MARLERLHLVGVERTAAIYDKQDPDDDAVDIDEKWSIADTAQELLRLLAYRGGLSAQEGPRPAGTLWAGFTRSQAEALENLAIMATYDWRPQPAAVAPVAHTLDTLDVLGVSYARVREAMRSIGIGRQRLEQLDRWAARRSSQP